MYLSEESLLRKMRVFGIEMDSDYKTILQFLSKAIIHSHDKNILEPIYKWCDESFEDNWIWGSEYFNTRVAFYFINEEDAVLFKLKFGT